MCDIYIASLIGGACAIAGGIAGAIVQNKFRKEELKRIETFQQNLADQNERLQNSQHEKEMEKFHEFGSAMYDKLSKIEGAIDQNN